MNETRIDDLEDKVAELEQELVHKTEFLKFLLIEYLGPKYYNGLVERLERKVKEGKHVPGEPNGRRAENDHLEAASAPCAENECGAEGDGSAPRGDLS